MKLLTCLLMAALSVPATAGLIRHDTPDSMYTGFATDRAFSGVGLIIGDNANSSYSCSGTVINKNWVLTAAHCVNEAKAISFYLPGEIGWNFYEADSWVPHENFSGDKLFAGWDIGLMHFANELNVAPAQLYNGASEWLSQTVSVGYGHTGNGETGSVLVDYQGRAGTNIIDDLWSEDGRGDQIIWSDFDHPTDSRYNLFGHTGVDFDDLATALEIMVAPGDSGGGVFIQENGQTYLAGVHSFISDFSGNGAFGYGDAYGSTRVSSFIGWVDGKMNPRVVAEPSGLLLAMLGSLAIFFSRKRKLMI